MTEAFDAEKSLDEYEMRRCYPIPNAEGDRDVCLGAMEAAFEHGRNTGLEEAAILVDEDEGYDDAWWMGKRLTEVSEKVLALKREQK